MSSRFALKAVICIKNFGFALRLRTFVQKFLTWGHNPQPQPQTQPSDHGSWICILWWRRRGLRPLWGNHKMQIQDPWSDGSVCACGCGLCLQVKNFCTKVLNLRAKPKFLMHMAISILYLHRKFWRSSHGPNFPRNFKRPKNGEDGSDFDDFWTKRIAALSAKFWKKIGPSKKFPRGRKIRKSFAKSSKNFGPYTVFGTKQNRIGHVKKVLTSKIFWPQIWAVNSVWWLIS